MNQNIPLNQILGEYIEDCKQQGCPDDFLSAIAGAWLTGFQNGSVFMITAWEKKHVILDRGMIKKLVKHISDNSGFGEDLTGFDFKGPDPDSTYQDPSIN